MAARTPRGRFGALANDRNLRRFVVNARPTGRHLGTGSYGAVEEVEVNGMVCAGKKLHELLLDDGNIGVRDIAERYVRECQLMSDLRHPNITQFMGLCFLPGSHLPVLVMERLDSSLDELLESIANIPFVLKQSILEDVAKGLHYLHKHKPQVIHRDLSAKNVLMTSSLVAKITDFGNSRMVNILPGQLAQTLSQTPGTLVYMPPEALNRAARYGTSLDIFSFGHLGIFVGLQVFPGDLLEPTYTEAEGRGRLLARSEVDRRGLYIQQLDYQLPRSRGGEEHPFVQLVKRCLENEPSDRPSSEELVAALEEMKADIEGPYGDISRVDAVREVVTKRALRKREVDVREKTAESAEKDVEIQHLQQELEHEQAERTRAEEQIQQRIGELEHEQAERTRAEEQIQQKDAQIQNVNTELQQTRTQLQQRTQDLKREQAERTRSVNQVQQKTRELQRKTIQLNSVQQSLQRLRAELKDRDTRLRAQEEEMQQRDAEINRLMEELRRCQEKLLRQQSTVAAVSSAVEEKDGTQPQGVQVEKKVTINEQTSSSIPATSDAADVNNPNNTSTAIISTVSSYRSSSNIPSSSGYSYKYNAKSDTGFVGLVNQGATGYLNCVLQMLYMTPEFRNALYQWEFRGHKEERSKSIPYQLQRLFLHLQTSDKRAVETVDVTKSFGWDSSEAWQPRDVQQLCQVLFDALEKRFKKDGYESTKNLIKKLYQGNMKDYVKCLECGHESAREDSFLDIPLVIKPFGSTTTNESVEQALKAFVQPESLKGDKQYFCEQCNKKCDAHKGLKFKRFPYLLTLQLKRFDFDYSTMHRIKLNDRMTFPTVLDLNDIVDCDSETGGCDSSEQREKELLNLYKDFVVDHFDQKPPPYGADHSSEDATPPVKDDVISGETVARLLSKGPDVYELFSVIVHSGNAVGGQYYVYIKSFSDRHWYCFNDQSVSRITREDLEKTFGGSDSRSRGYSSSVYASSANAYMLMYRRIDEKCNCAFTSSSDLPKHICRQIEEEKEGEEKELEKQARERNLCKFRLFCRHPHNKEVIEKRLEVHKDNTLSDAVAQAHKLLGLESVVPVERCRLVRYDEHTDTLDQSFDENQAMTTFGHHVGGARTYYSFELFLEIRGEGEEFRPYNKGGLNLKVLIIDLPAGTVRDPVHIRGEQTWKVRDLKTEIAQRCGLTESTMNIALETYNNDGKHLTNPNTQLKNEGFYRRHTVFVCCDAEDYTRDFGSSEMYQVIDKHANSILLNITVPPPPRKGVRKKLGAVDGNLTGLQAESAVDEHRRVQKTIELRIDRRCTLAELKTKLEDYVHIPSSEFKVYRIYSNNQEYEMFRVQDTLQSVPNDTKMVVRLGRALKPGEFRVKLSLLNINDPEFFKPLLDSIVAKGMTVKEFKQQVVQEAYEQGVDVPLSPDKMRLRKKTWRSPCTIFLDSQVFDKDIHVFANFEMYIECLDGPDKMIETTQMQVYVRHWHPSTYTVDKFQEIILSDNTPDHLKLMLSELSGIPADRVVFAKAYGSFPCEMSVLDIENDLDWNPTITTVTAMPLSIYDDGSILYLKDSKEQVAELTTDKRSELQKQEKARLSKYNTPTSSHTNLHRREGELKIKSWTEDDDHTI